VHDCWPATLSCLVAGGLAAMLRLLLADLQQVFREFGIDAGTIAGLGWTVAALLYLRLRIERARRPRSPPDPLARPRSSGPRGTREGDEPGGG
jgi:hypothetical protein